VQTSIRLKKWMNLRIIWKCSKLKHFFSTNRKSCHCPFHCNYLLIIYNLAVLFFLPTSSLTKGMIIIPLTYTGNQYYMILKRNMQMRCQNATVVITNWFTVTKYIFYKWLFSQDRKKQNEVCIAIASLLRSPGGIEAEPNLSAMGYNPSENVVYSLFGVNKMNNPS
jgi:hypothetical protein